MHFIPGWCVAQMVCNIWSCVDSVALIRFVLQGGVSYQKYYTHLLSCLPSAHFWYFFVLQGASSKTLNFRKNIEGSMPFLGVPLLLLMSGVFMSRLLRCRQTCWQFPHDLAWLLRPINSHQSLFLSLGCCCCQLFYISGLAGFLSLDSLIKRGLQNSWRDCFTLVSGVPGSFLPALCFCCRKKKY